MKPLRLKLKAFGPYVNLDVDFTALGGRRLFLIAGKTGSGKSAIFNAICYALYGAIKKGDTQYLKSDFASARDCCEVTLDFSVGRELYRVRRIPEQETVAADNKKGYRRQKAEAQLYRLTDSGDEGTLLASGADVSKTAETIVGLGLKEFRQVLILPQGEFAKFLNDTDADREALLKKLFGLQEYDAFIRALKDDKTALERELTAERAALEALLAQWRLTCADETQTMLAKLDADEASAKEEAQRAQRAGAEFLPRYTEQKILLSYFNDLDAAQKELAKLNAPKEQEKFKRLEFDVEMTERAKLLRSEADMLSDMREKAVSSGKLKSVAERQLKETQDWLKKCRQICLDLNDLEEANAAKKERLERLKLLREPVRECDAAREKYVKAKETEQDAREKETTAKKMLLDANDAETQRKLAYEQLTETFTGEQAAYLAQTLEEGSPCPVCGAKHHPCPATAKNTLPDRGAVERARAEYTKAADVRQKLQEAYETKDRELRRTEAELAACEADYKRMEALLDGKDMKPTDLEKEIADLDAQTDTFAEHKQQVERDRNAAEVAAKSAETALKLREKNWQEIVRNGTEFKEKFTEQLRKNGFTDENNFKFYLRRLANLEQDKNSLKEHLNAQTAALAKQKQAEKNIAGRELPDAEALETQNAELETRKKKALAAEAEAKSRRAALASVEQTIAAHDARIKTIEHQRALNASMLTLFTDTTQGRLSLGRFVLASYLDEVTAKANRHLDHMSDGALALHRLGTPKELAEGGGGFELMVHDLDKDKTRPTNFLSGGEKFQASMSLALGLSEVIQDYSGGVKLDSLFIDEGFGTLDEEALEKVLDVLETLTEDNRLVGVISHVSELETRIPAQLRVTKDRDCGSTAKFYFRD